MLGCVTASTVGDDTGCTTPSTAPKKPGASPMIIDEGPLAKEFRGHATKAREREERERARQGEKHEALMSAVAGMREESSQQTAALKAQASDAARVMEQCSKILVKIDRPLDQTATVLSALVGKLNP